ncbi:MAG: cytochrome c biogenesis protein CcdA [Syntrophales bacterium]|jgi:thiol:disulfide interchange protein DsbD
MIDQLTNSAAGYLQGSVLLAFLAAYIGGVLVSFSPCIYPVVPITVAFIGARSAGSRIKGFILSVFYVLGIALTYTILGAAAALSGHLFGTVQANPWVSFFMANVCIIMGLSMLNAFTLNIRTPPFITRLQPRNKAHGYGSSFVVGIVSGLIVGPCTAPVLAVLLSYAATRQNLPFAVSLMFIFALGMGTLLILLGTFAGLIASLPKSGAWMNRFSRACGWILIGAGEYFLIQAGFLWA